MKNYILFFIIFFKKTRTENMNTCCWRFSMWFHALIRTICCCSCCCYSCCYCCRCCRRRRRRVTFTSTSVDEHATPQEKLDKSFILAAGHGQISIVEQFLREGANLHSYEEAALREAVANKHLNVVKLLVGEGANIHVCGDIVFWYAVCQADLHMLVFLVQNNHNDPNPYINWALRLACGWYGKPVTWTDELVGNMDLIRLLLEHGADIHTCDDEPFRSAVRNEKYDLMRFLVEHAGANIHACDGIALRIAIRKKNARMVEFLIMHGGGGSGFANNNNNNNNNNIAINQNNHRRVRRRSRNTAASILFLAIKSGNVQIVSLLIKYGIMNTTCAIQNNRALQLALVPANIHCKRRHFSPFEENSEELLSSEHGQAWMQKIACIVPMVHLLVRRGNADINSIQPIRLRWFVKYSVFLYHHQQQQQQQSVVPVSIASSSSSSSAKASSFSSSANVSSLSSSANVSSLSSSTPPQAIPG